MFESDLWRTKALSIQHQVKKIMVGQQRAIHLLLIAIFSRGHVLLEGNVGVGKTTLLRAISRAVGGSIERIEGTVDLLPSDLVYHTYINQDGKPVVDHGPILKHGEDLSIFFFNEINRARPQVHSLMLRVLAERSVTAFNREFYFPHLQVFADRNRIERDETYEVPAAARDRFLMEFGIEAPTDPELQILLMSDTRFHDVDSLIEEVDFGIVDYRQLNEVSLQIQNKIHASKPVLQYAFDLCNATRHPGLYAVSLSDIDMSRLIQSGTSPRGMSLLLKAAKVSAWLDEREFVLPEDIRTLFTECIGHRVFYNPVYEMRREEFAGEFMQGILDNIVTP